MKWDSCSHYPFSFNPFFPSTRRNILISFKFFIWFSQRNYFLSVHKRHKTHLMNASHIHLNESFFLSFTFRLFYLNENLNISPHENPFVYVLRKEKSMNAYRKLFHISHFIILESSNLHTEHQKRISVSRLACWKGKLLINIFCHHRDMSPRFLNFLQDGFRLTVVGFFKVWLMMSENAFPAHWRDLYSNECIMSP